MKKFKHLNSIKNLKQVGQIMKNDEIKLEFLEEFKLFIESLIQQKIAQLVALLCKNDLNSSMVHEFPALQGKWGAHLYRDFPFRKIATQLVYDKIYPEWRELPRATQEKHNE